MEITLFFINKNVFQLYYLPTDYKEEKDLSAQQPRKLKLLKKELYKACDYNWENGLGTQVVKL